MVAFLVSKNNMTFYRGIVKNLAYLGFLLLLAIEIWGGADIDGFVMGVFSVVFFLVYTEVDVKKDIDSFINKKLIFPNEKLSIISIITLIFAMALFFSSPFVDIKFSWVKFFPIGTKKLIFTISWLLFFLGFFVQQVLTGTKRVRKLFFSSGLFLSFSSLLWSSPGSDSPFISKLQGDMEASGFIFGLIALLVLAIIYSYSERSSASILNLKKD